MDADGRLVSEADYWAYYYEFPDVHYEWNNGRLEEKPVSDNLTYWIYNWLRSLLDQFLKIHPIAKCTALEHGFRLALPDRVVIRKPDLAVVRNNNPVPLGDLERSYRGTFDLCIEALSDSDRAARERDEVEKRRDYAEGGVREYYIVHHNPERLSFLSRGLADTFESILDEDGIVRSRTLPGFQFRISDLIARTSIDDLRHEPVYRGFVHPQWQQAEQARDQAEQALYEAERQRDGAIGKLHALGLEPEQIAASLGIEPDLVRAHLADDRHPPG
ncbi:hypothetical protein CKO31_05435 [Thiohalocapsa halophila]|uniref:Putative restriction endonuclease domain-containing protein n=2 Tax=Thiohalocapsa halophila TaxID=69359 RepID=A0ABS1CE71_9GAMM|nr:hypothetical protein [Thiohalocapsa halophila]